MQFSFTPVYRGPLKAVVLDWAGTTMDYGSSAPAGVFVQVYAQEGVPITNAEARGPMGTYKKDHIRQISQMASVRERWQNKHGREPNEDDVERMYKNFIPLQLAVLSDYAELIPGTLDAIKDFRARGLKIGSTTGYTREMMEIVLREGARRGYVPDATVCASDVPQGRPSPSMLLLNMVQLQVYPPAAIVKIDDTLPGIDEGLNAGTWTIGVVKTGNELGLTEAEIARLRPAELNAKMDAGYKRMAHAGAHYVVDGIGDVPAVLDEIEARLRRGERP